MKLEIDNGFYGEIVFFVIKTNNHDYVGLGFNDRADSFDLNVALQDHFKSLRVEEEIENEANEPKENLML